MPYVFLLALLVLSTAVAAHDARPVAVTLEEAVGGVYRFRLRVPPTVEPANMPRLLWPDNCRAPQGTENAAAGVMVCAGGLEGRDLGLDFPLYNPSLSTVFRLQTLEGGGSMALLAPDEPAWRVPERPSRGNVARQYLRLGVEHIIGGADHLLFVLGLLVIARSAPRILLTVTGFTLAHSITLSLSSLGYLFVPIAPVEAGIALSILFLAGEISRGRRDFLTWRYPLLVSFGFGLLHGLGFASALGEIGFAPGEAAVSLLFFNLGVEAGQIAFILVLLALVWGLGKGLPTMRVRGGVRGQGPLLQPGAGRVEFAVAYLIGVPAAYWLIDRVAGFAF